jgi:hypothetical protein
MHEPIYWRSDMGLVDQLLPVQEQELIHRRPGMGTWDWRTSSSQHALVSSSTAQLLVRSCR